MLIIEHRKNTIEELRAVPKEHGVEIDIRSENHRLILHHESFHDGTDFERWLEFYDHKFLILNTKEEGLEERIKTLILRRRVADYFYLDLSFPFLVKLMNMGEKRIAVRFSEYESVETCLSLTGKVDWVWVDCFTRFPMDQECYHKLSRYFKICLVSPELVGRESEIEKVREAVDGMEIDAVCTKVPEKWSDLAYHKSVFCQK